MSEPKRMADPTGVDAADDDRRSDGRSNVFVLAALTTVIGSAPVRIRNMSRWGALVEGANVPQAGAVVRLSRGNLEVGGVVIWQQGNRAGLHFDAAAYVPDWLPAGKSSGGQQKIDEIVFAYKTGAPTLVAVAEAHAPAFDSAAELEMLRAMLRSAAEELASSSALTGRQLTALQTIDMVIQKLELVGGRAT